MDSPRIRRLNRWSNSKSAVSVAEENCDGVWATPSIVEIVARSGIPSPLKSAATSMNTVDPNEGDKDSSKPIPGMPAPREAVSSTLLPKLVSTNDTSPVGEAGRHIQ